MSWTRDYWREFSSPFLKKKENDTTLNCNWVTRSSNYIRLFARGNSMILIKRCSPLLIAWLFILRQWLIFFFVRNIPMRDWNNNRNRVHNFTFLFSLRDHCVVLRSFQKKKKKQMFSRIEIGRASGIKIK